MGNKTASIEAASACDKIIDPAEQACKMPAIFISPPASAPDFDALATSFASLSTAFTWGTVLLGMIALFFAIGWSYYIKVRAEHEAREIAKNYAASYISKWLTEEAPGIIRRHVGLLGDATIGNGDDVKAADDIGKNA